MPVKYQCVKCNRRFADWGAEKMGYKCPQDDKCPPDALGAEYELVRLGTGESEQPAVPAPTLKRRPKKEVIGVSNFDDEAVADTDADDAPFEASESEEAADDEDDSIEESGDEGGDTEEVDEEDEDSEEEEELDFAAETPAFDEDD